MVIPGLGIPRLVIAAPASGAGKTTVATGLMAALCRRGVAVAPFKAGPDYIDPGYHALAAGRPGRNLDPVLVGEERIGPLFAHGSAGAEIAIVEGVMGLFDGRVASGAGSTAQLAGLLDAPVLLVVDARGAGHSIAALLHGFRGYRPEVRIAGVVLNRVGSDRHEAVLREACAEVGLPVLGALRRADPVALPSRHLGLVPAAEHGAPAVRAVDAMAELVTRSVDLAAVLALAKEAGPLHAQAWDPAAEIEAAIARVTAPADPVVHKEFDPSTAKITPIAPHPTPTRLATGAPPREGGGMAWGARGNVNVGADSAPPSDSARPTDSVRPVVAVAGGPAFTFGYAEHAELLAAAGATVAVVDPLRDEQLPENTAALILPGGFPEQHAAELSANAALRAAVAEFARSGGVVHAECGGLLYLVRDLDGRPMCGVLDANAVMSESLTLGYRDAVAASDSALRNAGERVTGHEFHRTRVEPPRGAHPAWHWRGADGQPVTEGFVVGRTHASYLHAHPAGQPDQVARLLRSVGAHP